MEKDRRKLGCVVIGRNEGPRLDLCLRSLGHHSRRTVYVDSGSTDDSVTIARHQGVEVLELDMSIPFTAARARNAGFQKLLTLHSDIQFIQFLDGDCELAEPWLNVACNYLTQHPKTAIVFGRARERFPKASVYNLLCDIEWDGSPGPAQYCGGNAMMRIEPLIAVDGFNPSLIAGEEPDLCLRIRRHGWTIERIADDMMTHDAALLKFRQWWARSKRTGYAYAEGAWNHGGGPERHWVKEAIRVWVYGLVIPLIVGAMLRSSGGWSLLLLGIYPWSTWRAYQSCLDLGRSSYEARQFALFCTLAKFAQLSGTIRFHRLRFLGRSSTLIEHKVPKSPLF